MLTTQPNQLVLTSFETEVETPALSQESAPSPAEQAQPQAHSQKASEVREAATLSATTPSASAPLAYPTPSGYAVYALTKINPQANCARFYQLSYQPTLWANHCLHRSWGRIGKKLHTKEQEFASEEAALKDFKRLIRRKLRRGYRLQQSYSVAESANSLESLEATNTPCETLAS